MPIIVDKPYNYRPDKSPSALVSDGLEADLRERERLRASYALPDPDLGARLVRLAEKEHAGAQAAQETARACLREAEEALRTARERVAGAQHELAKLEAQRAAALEQERAATLAGERPDGSAVADLEAQLGATRRGLAVLGELEAAAKSAADEARDRAIKTGGAAADAKFNLALARAEACAGEMLPEVVAKLKPLLDEIVGALDGMSLEQRTSAGFAARKVPDKIGVTLISLLPAPIAAPLRRLLIPRLS